AFREGNRLGVQVGMHNAPGWSSSGGPWITPERSMQQLVWTETTATGPGLRDIQLQQPRANRGYYRDAFVLAFPAVRGDDKAEAPKITRSSEGVVMEYAAPFEARSITVQPPFSGRFPNVTLEASDDGTNYTRVTNIANPGRHGIQPPGARNFAAVRARFFRLRGAGAAELAEIALHGSERIEDWV